MPSFDAFSSSMNSTLSYIVIGIGIILVIIGLFNFLRYKNHIGTTGVYINSEPVRLHRSKRDVYTHLFQYEMNGSSYEGKSIPDSKKLIEGYQYRIYVNPDNPNVVVTFAQRFSGLVGVLVGIVLVVVGFIF